jgi:hypothetical protein
MSDVMKQPAVMSAPEIGLKGASLSSYLPAADVAPPEGRA